MSDLSPNFNVDDIPDVVFPHPECPICHTWTTMTFDGDHWRCTSCAVSWTPSGHLGQWFGQDTSAEIHWPHCECGHDRLHHTHPNPNNANERVRCEECECSLYRGDYHVGRAS